MLMSAPKLDPVKSCDNYGATPVRQHYVRAAADLTLLMSWHSECYRLLYSLGRVMLLSPGARQLSAGLIGTEVWMLAFEPGSIDSLTGQTLDILNLEDDQPFIVIVPECERRHWEDRFRYLQSVEDPDLDAEREAMRALLKCSLLDCFRLARTDLGVRASGFHTMRFVLTFIEKNYHKPIKLQDVAEAANFSPAYLTDLVRRETGLPIHRWVTHYRLAAAKRLLKDTNMPISAIAEEVGFGNGSYFCRQFNRLTGFTPGAWRKIQRADAHPVVSNAVQPAVWHGDEAQLRMIMDTIPQLVWAKNEDGSLLYANKRWYAYTGLTVEQSVGWGWLSAIYPDDRNRCLASWSAARAMESEVKYHARLMRGIDSTYRWHLIHTIANRSSQEGARWFGTATDVDDELDNAS